MATITDPMQIAQGSRASGRAPLGYGRQLLLRVPLLPISVGLIAGIVLDRSIPLSWIVHVGLFLLAGLLLRRAFQAQAAAAPLAIGSLLLASTAVGGLRHQVTFWRVGRTHIINLLAASQGAVGLQPSETLARLRGRIVTEPIIRFPEPPAYGLQAGDRPRTSFTLDIEQVFTSAGWIDADGLLRVSAPGAADHVRVGDEIEFLAALRPIEGPRNPGEYDWRLHNRRCGLYLTASVASAESLQRLSHTGGDLPVRLLGRFRAACRGVLLDGIAADRPEAGLLATYVAGQRSAVSRRINDAFRRSGTAHLLAVSGSHVSLIATAGAVGGGLLLRGRRRGVLLTLPAVIFFSLLVDPNAPALRAAIMALLAVGGLLLDRPFNSSNWLVGSAIALLLVSPAELFTPPFQMTFAAVIGLIWLTPPVCDLLFGPHDLAGWLRLRVRLIRSPTQWDKAALTAKSAISYSSAAWLANLPLLAWHFGQINPYGHVATLMMAPLAGPLLILGFCKMLLGLLSPTAGIILAWPVRWMAGAMTWLADWLGRWPGANLLIPSPPLWWLFLAYGFLAYWALVSHRRWHEASPFPDRRRRMTFRPILDAPADDAAASPDVQTAWPAPTRKVYRPIRPRIVITLAAILTTVYVAAAWWPNRPGRLRMHVLSVGNGLCVLVQGATGRTLLYDCGSLTVGSVGKQTAAPALSSMGIRRIDAAVLSHPDSDHYNGLIDLAETIPIKHVWLNDAFSQGGGSRSSRRLLDDLKALRVPVDVVAQGDSIPNLGPLTAEVLWPPAGLFLPSRDANDTSVVLRVCCGDQTILLTGDAGPFAQARLARDQRESIRADVLLLPHHGSSRTLTPDFIQIVDPQVAVISTVDSRRTDALTGLAPPDCLVLDTQSCGMVTIDLAPAGLEVTIFRTGRRTIATTIHP